VILAGFSAGARLSGDDHLTRKRYVALKLALRQELNVWVTSQTHKRWGAPSDELKENGCFRLLNAVVSFCRKRRDLVNGSSSHTLQLVFNCDHECPSHDVLRKGQPISDSFTTTLIHSRKQRMCMIPRSHLKSSIWWSQQRRPCKIRAADEDYIQYSCSFWVRISQWCASRIVVALTFV